ncbi:MAG: hypothetical protein JWM56_446 [Candidatus Peribacteria bacterium]|nr:hypothetical protein [Candidatus Peribacteria bacterium]
MSESTFDKVLAIAIRLADNAGDHPLAVQCVEELKGLVPHPCTHELDLCYIRVLYRWSCLQGNSSYKAQVLNSMYRLAETGHHPTIISMIDFLEAEADEPEVQVNLMKHALSLGSDNIDHKFRLVDLLLRSKQADEASKAIIEIFKLDPIRAQAFLAKRMTAF